MVNVSKKKLDEHVFNRLYGLVFEVFVIKRSEADFKNFFMSIFSTKERIMLVKRIGVIYLILKGLKKNDICKFIKISHSTFDKYKQILDMNSQIYDYFSKIIRTEKFVNLLEELIDIFYGPGTPGVDWSEAWKTKRRISKRKTYGF